MFGPRLSKVFKSRWHALLWAGSILLTAYCSVPSSPGHPGDADQVASLVSAVHGDKPHRHVNPWAKDAD